MRDISIVCLNNLPFLPYVHGLLRSAVESDAALAERFRFREPVFVLQPVEEIVERVLGSDVLGFSCYVWNVRRHMAIARRVKERRPQTLIVAGGPHVPDRPEEFAREHPYVDVLVHGEGEDAFCRVLERLASGLRDWTGIGGISFAQGGATVTAARSGARPPREIRLRSPYTAGYLDGAIDECRRRNRRFYALWETNRGCPFSCTFCDWGSATMSNVRLFDEASCRADVEFFGRERIPNVFICDANFGMLPRDVELARLLGEVHDRTGFPQQIRVNFAKNSNERVFAISCELARRDMSMGTTLSVQSMDADVLEAIARKNIKFDNLRELNARYAAAGIPTYSEVILGLPEETMETFKGGIGALLETGAHADVRTYELTLLPNAPISTPESRERYGLRTIEKSIYGRVEGAAADEDEVAELVIATRTMPTTDWIECQVFAQVVQALHCGGYTRFLAIHLRRAYGIPYHAFYDELIGYFSQRPRTVLGRLLHELRSVYARYAQEPALPQLHLVASVPYLAQEMRPFGDRRGWTPADCCWLYAAVRRSAFYDELAPFVAGRASGEEIAALLRYQNDVMLAPEYDPALGKTSLYPYDFPAYFADAGPLRRRSVEVARRDRLMGINRDCELKRGDLAAFARAAVGESYPIARVRRYIHQPDAAEVSYAVAV